MKQLADGKITFYTHKEQGIKKMIWAIIPLLLSPLIVVGFVSNINLKTLVLVSLILTVGIVLFACAIVFIIQKFVTLPSLCTISEQSISWKDMQDSVLAAQRTILFKDIQGFYIKREFIDFYKGGVIDKVLCFVAKQPDTTLPFFPYFAWLSTQDQQVLLKLLKEKGLTFLPENYTPQTHE